MPRKKEKPAKDESLDTEETSPDETEGAEAISEAEDLLPETPPRPRGKTSGAFWAILLIFVVIVLVVAVYITRENARRRENERREAERERVRTQLTTVRDNVREALRQLDSDSPNVEGAVKALNDARAQIGEFALQPGAQEVGLSAQLVDLQGQISAAADALVARNDQYEETIKAAREELRKGSMGEVEPLLRKLDAYISQSHGDAETPILVPGMASVSSGEEPAKEEPTPTKSEEPQNP